MLIVCLLNLLRIELVKLSIFILPVRYFVVFQGRVDALIYRVLILQLLMLKLIFLKFIHRFNL
jgi:hypothetical protein